RAAAEPGGADRVRARGAARQRSPHPDRARGARADPGRGAGVSTTVGTDHLIKPHGGQLLERTGPRPEGVDELETIVLTSRELSDLDMLASGALSPLQGCMCRVGYERVAEDMRLPSGLPW